MINKEEKIKISSKEMMEEHLKEAAKYEQLYSIALFDILGFSNFVEENRTDVILNLYNELIDLVYKQQTNFETGSTVAGSIVPVPTSRDWKNNQLIAQGNGYINVCHFSDTFLIYVNYEIEMKGFWLADSKYEKYPLLMGEIGTEFHPAIYQKHNIYISFLQTCMDFFCKAISKGIPLRGCISTGPAIMNKYNSTYLGKPLVEAAKGETAQNSLGIAFGKSFNNYHPVYNDYFIPYLSHIKKNKNSKFLSPMLLDWARYWRNNAEFSNIDLINCINMMNKKPEFSSYYDNAIKYVKFSKEHDKWYDDIDRDGINDILDYYRKTKEWYNSVI